MTAGPPLTRSGGILSRRVLIALFVVLLPAVTPRIYASDEVQWFAFLRSLWFDHDVSFENEYEYFEAKGIAKEWGFRETHLQSVTETGHRLNYGTVGCALLWAPFYAVGDATARLLRAAGYPVAVDGYSRPYIAAVCYGSAFYGFAALMLSMTIANRLIGIPAGVAAVAVWFGTPLFFYMYLAPVFAHACSAFAVALFLFTWLNVRRRWSPRGLAALGAAAALMVMVREQDMFFVCGPILDFGIDAFTGNHHPRRLAALIGAATAGLTTAALTYLPQAIVYLRLNGRIGPSRLVTRKMYWTAPHALSVLFSPEHGLSFWTPLAALGIVGLLAFWMASGASTTLSSPDRRRIAGCLVVMAALQVYVAGSVDSWTVAGAFGQRRFVSLTAILVVGLAALWQLSANRTTLRAVTVAAIVVGIWWNVGLMAQFGLHTMDRQRLTLADNARQTFVELPMTTPALAWRYLTDRTSFYNQPRR
jgi:hypothetical protein